MTPSNRTRAQPNFRVTALQTPAGGTDYDTRITLFSGRGAKVDEADGSISRPLPRGIYTVRTERFGELGEDLVILHERDTEKTIEAPRRDSAMPSSDTVHTKEFLQAAAHRYSRETTWTHPTASADDPLLMILVRASGDEDHSDEDPAASLRLIDETGAVVSSFQPDRVALERREGWVVFSVRLAPGNYMLTHVNGPQAVSLPILLTSERWNTLVFVPFDARPNLSTASIDMCRRDEGYNPDDHFTQQIDAAVLGLGIRLDLLSPQLRNEAIYGKFSHPFHGLIGAYAHFLGSRKSERLERQVLRNLWRLLEGSADAVALLLLAHERETGSFPTNIDAMRELTADGFSTPPMEDCLPQSFPPLLRASLDVLVRASAELPDLIAPGSWLEAAANSSFADGPWAVWRQDNAGHLVDARPDRQAPQALSRQRVYPAIKRAIARDTTRDARSISADDRLDELFDDHSDPVPRILDSISEEIPDYRFRLDRPQFEHPDRVRDLVRGLIDEAELLDSPQIGLEPDIHTPEWLVNMVRDRTQVDGSDFEPAAVARMAGVPLSSVQRAVELADKDKG